ncbi:YfhD family protein [Virgibacillus sp. W0430]|uniref:YfhD family protein n=1 Tax=Virgibacillus sp. W0430 TaxID=3391580 RepID=UPI003F449EF4
MYIFILTIKNNEVIKIGRDEHKKARGKRALAQTPKNELTDGMDIEFSEELADLDDKVAQKRSRKAEERSKR